MKRTQTIALVALLAALIVPVPAFAATTSTSNAAGSIRLAALSPRIPDGATRLGRLPSQQKLMITIALRPSHEDELSALLRDLYDPTSPRYEQWLATGEFARRFGPDPARIERVTSWLHDHGLSDTTVQGMAVRASGNADEVARAFDVSFSRYRLAPGGTGYVASAAPLVPRAVADDIATVVGLSDTVRFDNALDLDPHSILPSATAAPAATPKAIAAAGGPRSCPNAVRFAANAYWTPNQVGHLYHVNDLHSAGLTGRGKTIALFEFAPSRAADIARYLACFGLHNHVSVRRVDGGATPDQTGTLEANLDIQQAATQAPGASLLSYETPNSTTGEYDAYNQIVTDNRAQVVSISWGKCEAAVLAEPNGAAFINSLHSLFQQAAAQGQSMLSVTGDTGSEDCYDGTRVHPSESLQVDHPADDPLVTSVGGTSLEQPNVETLWNDCEGFPGDGCASGGGHAGGGGQSTHFGRPRWQPLAPNATCSTCREVPDISANAGVGETFYDSDMPASPAGSPDHWTAVGGTSIATPMLAGFVAVIAQSCAAGRLGNFAPKLYALAAKRVYGTALTDIRTGINWTNLTIENPGSNDLTHTHTGAFRTTTGYDLASGIGAPIAPGLACPQITTMSPNHSERGHTRVTLAGVGLERATIKFGHTIAKVLSAGPKSAVVIVPPGKGTVKVSGVDPMGTGSHRASFSYPGKDTGAYPTATASGHVFNFGPATAYGSPNPSAVHAPIVGMAVDHATGGYWLVGANGKVYNFHAPFLGDASSRPLNQPIVGIAANTAGNGYWLVARDGGIFAFGKARFAGSTGGRHLNRPIVGISADPRTGGYWLVASDGGIYAFNAPFYGSTGALHLNKPIVGISADAATGGYWLVASDGGVFAFNAPFYGSTGALHLNKPIVGISATDDARGYRFVASDGGVFNFGDARFSGSTGGSGLRSPVVAVTDSK